MGIFPNLGNIEILFSSLTPSFTDPGKQHAETEVMKATREANGSRPVDFARNVKMNFG